MGWEWRKTEDGLYLTIPEWAERGAMTAFSARRGGFSQAPYASLNLGLHVGDEAQRVIENRSHFLGALGYSLDQCVAAQQVHGTKVVAVSAIDQGSGMKDYKTAIPSCDALVTREPLGLFCLYADCVPVYFFCPSIQMVGLAHAGWKGTVNRIVEKVIDQIHLAGGSNSDCYAAIGPSIGACCYEVGEEVAELGRKIGSTVVTASGQGKCHLDLAKANEELLKEAGIPAVNISVAGLCTACHPELFYSYRRDGSTGRMGAFIMQARG